MAKKPLALFPREDAQANGHLPAKVAELDSFRETRRSGFWPFECCPIYE
jgi:hypothetical protein